jgi:multisubunit Na+/H+ antiporter MnhE subunit
MRIAFATATMAIVYLVVLASTDPWDIAAGILLGLGVLLLFRDFLFQGPSMSLRDFVSRAIHFPRLVVAEAAAIIRGTVTVTRAVIAWHPPEHAGFVEIPIGERTPTGVIVSAWLNTLSPGSVFIGTDPEATYWAIHVLDAPDKEAIREEAQQFYELYQRPVWP